MKKILKRVQPEWYTIHETISGHQLDKRNSLEIECDTLDSIIDNYKVDFIKIDIEGAEVEALKGAANTLERL
jgi:FkbM family methyltransferase